VTSFRQKLRHELKAVALTTLFFAVWLGALIVLKMLVLAEYRVQFYGLSKALVGALILAKVVLVLEHVPLGAWVRRKPAVLEVLLRTVLYTCGVFVVLLIEKAFEARHEHGGFGPALTALLQHADLYHVVANTICVACALLVYNALTVVRDHVGDGVLGTLFLAPRRGEPAQQIREHSPKGAHE
jgi:hypothetical protein